MTVLPWRRMGFRIAVTIIVALVAIQGLNLLVFHLSPRLAPRTYGARLLGRSLAAEAPRAFAAAPGAVMRIDVGGARVFSLRRVDAPPGGRAIGPDAPYDLRLLAASLQARAPDVAEVRLNDPPPMFRLLWFLAPGRRVPPPERDHAPDPRPGGAALVAPLDDDSPDVGYLGPLHFLLRGPGSAWVVVDDAREDGLWSPYAALPLASLLASLLAVVALAQWFAARETGPLRALAETAERIGRGRGSERARFTPLGGSHEVIAVGEALDRMQERISAFLDQRRLMLAALSHDLRTPLTRMRLAVHGLADADRRGELIAEIEAMSQLVESTLRFAHDDAEDEPKRAVDLAVLAQSLCDDISDHGGRAAYHGPDHCILDLQPLAIKRALANVVENACKFGKEAEVVLTDRPDAAIVEILDHGPGIAPELREEAFTPFRRLEATAQDRPGAGLGLTIARDAVAAQGGAIGLANRESGGLRVTIRLPRAAAKPAS